MICPGCQAEGEWAAELDHCAVCASVALVRRLGEVECRDCGATGERARPSGPLARPADASASDGLPDGRPVGLTDEVEQALAKVLNRTSRATSPSATRP
jgi:hypothetical protein